MALVHRINAFASPLLNTFCYKCTVNITRYKTQRSSEKQWNRQPGTTIVIEWEKFEEMIASRQQQADRSVLIKIKSIDKVHEVEQFCSRFTNIAKMFPYTTDYNSHYILMEFKSLRSMEIFQERAQFPRTYDSIQSVSQLYKYPHPNAMQEKTSVPVNPKQAYEKCSLTNPFTNESREQLLSMKSASDQMCFLHNIFKVTELNLRLRFYTAQQLSYHLSGLFANMSVVPFGSSVNGFGQAGCDLDLLCKINNSKRNQNNPAKFQILPKKFSITNRLEQKEFLEIVGTVIQTCIPGIIGVHKILNARVPIIRFANINTNMKCDLSSTNEVALRMSEMLYTYGQLDNRVKPLVCIIRKWARVNGITKDNAGHWITNFSLTLLIIFYLQTKNYLPSLNAVTYLVDTSKTKDVSHSCFSWFSKWKDSIGYSNNDSLYNLLQGFFEYYSLFNYKDNGICIREAQVKRNPNGSPLYIYNPFDTALNVSKNITCTELIRIVDRFRSALNILSNRKENECIMELLNLRILETNSGPSSNFSNQIYSNVNERLSIARKTDAGDQKLRERSIIK